MLHSSSMYLLHGSHTFDFYEPLENENAGKRVYVRTRLWRSFI